MGGLGVAVAAGAAIWTLWTQHAEAARKKAAELEKKQLELGKAIIDGNRDAAVADFHSMYDKAISSATTFGLKAGDVTAFITGQTDAIPGLTDKYHELTAARDAASTPRLASQYSAEITAIEDQQKALDAAKTSLLNSASAAQDNADAANNLADILVPATAKQKDFNKSVSDSVPKLSDAEQATRDNADALDALTGALDKKRAIEDFRNAMVNAQTEIQNSGALSQQTIRDVENAIIHLGQVGALNPVEVATALDELTPTDINVAFLDAQSKVNAKGPVKMPVVLDMAAVQRQLAHGVPLSGNEVISGTAAQITINMPTGARYSDVARATGMSTRRNGRRYGVTR